MSDEAPVAAPVKSEVDESDDSGASLFSADAAADRRRIVLGAITLAAIVLCVCTRGFVRPDDERRNHVIWKLHAVAAVVAIFVMLLHASFAFANRLALAAAGMLVAVAVSYAFTTLRKIRAIHWFHCYGGVIVLTLAAAHAIEMIWFAGK